LFAVLQDLLLCYPACLVGWWCSYVFFFCLLLLIFKRNNKKKAIFDYFLFIFYLSFNIFINIIIYSFFFILLAYCNKTMLHFGILHIRRLMVLIRKQNKTTPSFWWWVLSIFLDLRIYLKSHFRYFNLLDSPLLLSIFWILLA
jgi:hypothetical protein